MKKIIGRFVDFFYDFIYIPFVYRFIYLRDEKKIIRAYGDFTRLNNTYFRKNTSFYYGGKERKFIALHMADVSRMIRMIDEKPKQILLDGDIKLIVPKFKKFFGLFDSNIITVGLGKDFDYDWNFENDPPKSITKNKDLIVSQAMMEHLIDPYKHLKDLVGLLKIGGYIIVHSQLPGYPYHRYPINTLSFYPDWFEECGKRLGLEVTDRSWRNFHLCYLFKKVQK